MRQCTNYLNEVEEQLYEDNSFTWKLLSGFEIYPVTKIIFNCTEETQPFAI